VTFFSLILASALLSFGESDAQYSYDIAAKLVSRYTPRVAGTPRGAYAANFIFNEVTSTGADARVDKFEAVTPEGRKQFCNVYAKFVFDPSQPWIVLLSHFDTKKGVDCPGANDGASTTGLLTSLSNILIRERLSLKRNLLFVWTDGEECYKEYSENDGLWGAKRALEHIKSQDYSVRAVVCLDMLGDKNLNISLPQNTTPVMRRLVRLAAKRTGFGKYISEINDSVIDDHAPFFNAGYNVVNLIDFMYGSEEGRNDYWHTSKDIMENISVKSLEISGKLLVEIINILCLEKKK
jgi:Zn-dependent M28 family amino/carboxypeptidase